MREEAQFCLDYCWIQTGMLVPYLDGDGVACEPTPPPWDELAARFAGESAEARQAELNR
jgi:hypothetical protein